MSDKQLIDLIVVVIWFSGQLLAGVAILTMFGWWQLLAYLVAWFIIWQRAKHDKTEKEIENDTSND